MNSKETPENVQHAAEIMAVVIKRIRDGSTSTSQAVMNLDPWGFLDDLLDTSSRTFRSMRARAAGRFPRRKKRVSD